MVGQIKRVLLVGDARKGGTAIVDLLEPYG